MAMAAQPLIHSYQPCPALRGFVNGYTVVYLSCNEPFVRVQPAFASEYLIFYPLSPQKYSLDGKTFNRLPQELLIGPFTRPVFLLQLPDQIMVFVNLPPGSLHRFIHLPMNQIVNQPMEAINGFGSEIKTINEQLADAGSPEKMIHLIEAFLVRKLSKIKDGLPIDQVFKLLITSPHQYTIDQLADLACVSSRQFERQFLNRIGTTPTMFIRQARFGNAYRLKRRHPQMSWTSIAYECGYFDQMHLIREFKLFTSSTPRSFTGMVRTNAAADS
jgi:AraC-like DNA-binding protein